MEKPKKKYYYQAERPVCVVCRKRTTEFKYDEGRAKCLLCLEKEKEKAIHLEISERDAKYWEAYRKYLGVG